MTIQELTQELNHLGRFDSEIEFFIKDGAELKINEIGSLSQTGARVYIELEEKE